MPKSINGPSEIEFPRNLHARIIKNLFFLRLKTPLLIGVALLSLNLLISGWHIWTKMVEMETISIMKDMLEGFELSYVFVSDFAHTMIEFFPIGSTIIFFVNALIVGYGIYIFLKLKEMKV